MVAVVEVAPDFGPHDMDFEPGSMSTEAPLGMLADLYPETFATLSPSDFQIASTFNEERRISAHLIRLKGGRLFVLTSDFM